MKRKKQKRIGKALRMDSEEAKPTTLADGQLSRAEAEKLQAKIVDDFRNWESSAILAAVDLDQFVRGKGWIALGYERMTDWREKEIPEADFYYLRNVLKLLSEGVPTEKIERMRITNVNTMARALPPAEWKKPVWQEAAATLPTKEFTVKAHKVSDDLGQHVEILERRGFQVAKSIAENWDLALRIAEALDGAESMERRIEAIVSNYLNSPSEAPGKNKLQAYEAMNSEEIAEAV